MVLGSHSRTTLEEINYDGLIVLDKGAITEFDTPWKVIQKENVVIRLMALKSDVQ